MKIVLNNLILVILLGSLLTSCRCHTDFEELDNDSVIETTAKMSQGMDEFLVIKIKIKRTDSLYVKNITITPYREGDKSFPDFLKFDMYSYFYIPKKEKTEGPYWENYYAETFDQLPTKNRFTNKNNLYVNYSAIYTSDNPIKFEEFSAEIEVLLITKTGEPIILNKKVKFKGKRECRFSFY